MDCFEVDEASATSGGFNEPKKCSGRKKQAILCVVFEGTTMERLERSKSLCPHQHKTVLTFVDIVLCLCKIKRDLNGQVAAKKFSRICVGIL